MFSARFSNPPTDHVLRELPVSSIDSDANVERSLRSGHTTIVTLSPDRPPRVPLHMGRDGPFCSPVQYLYATGRTRRRLELNPGESNLDRPLSPSFDDFVPNHTSTPGPSSPLHSTRAATSSRKRHATPTSDYYSQDQLGSPEKSLLYESVSWLRRVKKARRERHEVSGELTKRLRALTPDQLATVISDLLLHHPDLEEELQGIIPEPDISLYEEKVSELLHNIYRAMPRQRLSSSRSAYCYRRVRLHIITFKKQCVQTGRHFLRCRAWDAAIRYVLAAWPHVHKLPVWECPAHNRLKTGCYQGLSAVCVEALRNGGFSLQALEAFRPRIEAMVSSAPEMRACLQKLEVLSETSSEA